MQRLLQTAGIALIVSTHILNSHLGVPNAPFIKKSQECVTVSGMAREVEGT